MGCYAMQPEDYDALKPFFSKALARYHGVAEDATHTNDWSLEGVRRALYDSTFSIRGCAGADFSPAAPRLLTATAAQVEGLPEGGALDLEALGLPALSMRVRVGRNLAAFPLPGAMTKEQRCELENAMLAAGLDEGLPSFRLPHSRLYGESLQEEHIAVTNDSAPPSIPRPSTSWSRWRTSAAGTSPPRTCRSRSARMPYAHGALNMVCCTGY
jgi:hypothetical protein